MDEAVIRRMTGGRDVMRRQLSRLQQIIEEDPKIFIRIVPFERGMYPLQQLSYWLFEFADPKDEYVLYIENPQGSDIIREGSPEEETRDSPVQYLGVFWELEQIVSRDGTLRILQGAIKTLTNQPPRPLPTGEVVGSDT
jgi:hypothetical protein